MTHLESDVSRSKALADDKTGAASSCYDTRPEVKLKGTGGGTRRGQTQEAAQPVALPSPQERVVLVYDADETQIVLIKSSTHEDESEHYAADGNLG
jgi:hypothetical protein